ncbi:MAG TPA: hypothetical protein DEQ09_03405 [Bacteroidales bacterium]|nr:hypothetical protein [Bacteroidales bacterium]
MFFSWRCFFMNFVYPQIIEIVIHKCTFSIILKAILKSFTMTHAAISTNRSGIPFKTVCRVFFIMVLNILFNPISISFFSSFTIMF